MYANSAIIGHGSFATVTAINGVAIKTIPHEHFESAVREICIVGALDHPNIISIISAIYCDSTMITMKQYSQDLSRLGPMPIYRVSLGIIRAVKYIHDRGFIHADIKPGNILLDGEFHAVLCDFGISMIAAEKYHSSCVQTVTYRAPEVDETRSRIQFNQKIDVWGVGCVLFEISSGCPFAEYESDNNDSTIYACKFFKLCHCESRRERMHLLRDVNNRYIGMIIGRAYADTKYNHLTSTGFISLITICLQPDHRKRASSTSAKILIENIIKEEPVGDGAPIILQPACEDWIGQFDATLIIHASDICMNLAYSVYTRYGKKEVFDKIYAHAALYIAACVCSGSVGTKTILRRLVNRADLHTAAVDIMIMLKSRIF